MGMSTHLIGLVSPDDEIYKKHANVLKACHESGIKELPAETAKFFGYTHPELCALEEKLTVKIPYTEYSEYMVDGFEVDVTKIPIGVTKLRFYNSY